MNTLTFLSYVTSSTLGLNVLGCLTERAATYLARVEREAREPQPLPPAVEAVVQAEPPAPAVVEETAGHWWKRLFTPAGILGFLVTPLQVPILVINSSLLAVTLETILNRPGFPLLPLNLFGWERDITDLDLIGVLISLGQMIAASALHLAWHERQRFWLVFGLALTALPSLVAYEVGASVYRGWQVEGDPRNAGLSGLIALGIATLEGAVGILVIDLFLIPLLLAVLWSVAAPFRAIVRWWARRRAVQWYEVRPPRRDWPHPAVLAVVYPLAALDKALMAPLRRLDRAVGALLPGSMHRKGGDHHATPPVVTHPHNVPVSPNGRDPVGMPGDQRRHLQAADHLDDRT
jgi:hypothetical protein